MKIEEIQIGPDLLSKELMDWYEREHRDLPFRKTRDAYAIWISEVMAQQTRMEALIPYYERFLKQYPTLASLADAKEDELMKLWEGLGYYSRARNLQKAAKICMEKYGGKLPDAYEKLKSLPGIGPYTAGAVASIAYNEKVPAVDGNVIRVFSRLFEIEENTSRPAVRKAIEELVRKSLPEQAGIYNQALMELGALVCTPASPCCNVCPVKEVCQAFEHDQALAYPIKDAARKKKKEIKTIYIIASKDGSRIHMMKRNEGLLKGLYGFDETLPSIIYRKIPLGSHTHVFTHVVWEMEGCLILSEADKSFITIEGSSMLPVPGAFAPFYKKALEELKELEHETA